MDIEPRMHEMMSSRMLDEKINNIELVRAEITRIPISDFAIDHVLAAFVYHEVDDRRLLMAEASRILRAGGGLTLVDFQKRETSIGPPVSERRTPKDVLGSAPKNLNLVGRFESETYYQLEFLKS
jgi:ubiquinone/menaquinone biosynthesis C-methylase UbiE